MAAPRPSPVPPAELAEVARLTDGEEDEDHVLERIAGHAVTLVPGCSAAGLTVSHPDGGHDLAATDERVPRCHVVQFHADGNGPGREALAHGEPRRIDDLDDDRRWPPFAAAARECGFRSVLALPLRSEPLGTSALNLYSERPRAFADTTFDVALLFAAQGGVALHNAALYRGSKHLVEHLHRALISRSLIERAKGLLMGQLHVDSREAFTILRERSQGGGGKLRDVAAAVLKQDSEFSFDVPWTPVRAPARRPQPEKPRSEGTA